MKFYLLYFDQGNSAANCAKGKGSLRGAAIIVHPSNMKIDLKQMPHPALLQVVEVGT